MLSRADFESVMTEFPEMQDVLMKQVRCLRGVSASLVIARGPLTRLLLSIYFFVSSAGPQ